MVVGFISSGVSLSLKPIQSNYLPRQIPLGTYRRYIKKNCIKRQQILPSALNEMVGTRVFVLSDLHTDYSENMMWVKCLSTVQHKKDVLLVAGDVAETYETFFF